MFDTARFEHTWRIAKAMSMATLLPDHLRLDTKTKQPLDPKQVESNLLRIVNQAIRWQVDPYAVVDCTYVVANKLGYEGKLVAGVINARAGLKSRLSYEFTGTGTGRTVTVSGTFEGEDEPRTIELSVGQAKTANKMWTSDPDQKLVYSAATKWARRHCPEIMLGVLTDHDLEVMRENGSSITAIAVTDDRPPLSEVIKAAAEANHTCDPPCEPDIDAASEPDDDIHKADPDAEPQDDLDLRMDDYRQAYEQATTIAEIDALDAQARADKLVAARPYQEAILGDHEKSFSRIARSK
jgi:hypothetical protein